MSKRGSGMVENKDGQTREHDEAGLRENRRIACPALILWSLKDDLERLHGDVLDIWRLWTTILQGRGLDCRRHMAEEAPEGLTKELLLFLTKS
jgi:haloacetate dehalogenase